MSTSIKVWKTKQQQHLTRTLSQLNGSFVNYIFTYKLEVAFRKIGQKGNENQFGGNFCECARFNNNNNKTNNSITRKTRTIEHLNGMC